MFMFIFAIDHAMMHDDMRVFGESSEEFLESGIEREPFRDESGMVTFVHIEIVGEIHGRGVVVMSERLDEMSNQHPLLIGMDTGDPCRTGTRCR